jgi:uncharacterized protein YecT (DUF1311 family)
MSRNSDPADDFETQLGAKLEAMRPESLGVRAINTVKEWGGVATVLIAILYTFPFEIFDRVINWRSYDITESRKILAQLSELQADKTSSLDRLQDKRNGYFLGSMFDIRIYNLLVSNKNMLLKSIDRLSYSESYAVGSGYSLSGLISDGIPFYEAAIKKAKVNDDNSLVTIYREFGRALFGELPGQDINRAREMYGKLFDLFNAKLKLINSETYFPDLYEYGGLEMSFGDLNCGKAIAAYALVMEKEIAAADFNNELFGGLVKGNESDFKMRSGQYRQSNGVCNKIEMKPMHLILTKALAGGHDPGIDVPVLGSTQSGTVYPISKDDPARGKADQDEADPLHPPSIPAPRAEAPLAPPRIEAEATPPPAEKPAPREPAPALRTPTMFDCTKQHMGTDFVICASPELMDAEARLEDAYKAARAAKGDQVKTEQLNWIRRYGPDCGLPLKGQPPEEKIHGVAGCVREAMEERIKELHAEQ